MTCIMNVCSDAILGRTYTVKFAANAIVDFSFTIRKSHKGMVELCSIVIIVMYIDVTWSKGWAHQKLGYKPNKVLNPQDLQ